LKENIACVAVRNWIESFVIKFNLCPFVKRELANNKIRIISTDAKSEQLLLKELQAELEILNSDDTIETTLLVHPYVLQDFYDYNEFLSLADKKLIEMNLEGVYQIASFHPDYQFSGTEPDDVENYTNRSPYPMLHVLREDSLEKAIASYTDINQIPTRNIELMRQMGKSKLSKILHSN